MDSEEENEIEYSYLYIGMSGRDMTDALNSNFRNTITKFSDIADKLNLRIISNTIKYVKVENDIVSYSEDNENWHSINVWGAIKGNITNQTDLKNALGDKVNIDAFNTLSGKVNQNTEDILNLSGDTTNLSNEVQALDTAINDNTTGILVRLNTIDTALTTKVSSPQIKAIRTTDGNKVEFTTDGTNWKYIFDGTVSWGNITGSILNQTDLNTALTDINNLILDINNDITDLDDRIDIIEDRLENSNPVVYMTEINYRSLNPKDEDTIYIVSPEREL